MSTIGRSLVELLRSVRHRRPRERGVRILTYHGVVERRTDPRVEESFHLVSELEAHVAMLRRCRVIGLDELEEAGRTPSRWPCVAITFDDGFRNNLRGVELLARARLPATIFVSTQCVDEGRPIWPTLLRLALARGSARVLRLGGAVHELDRDPSAFASVRTRFKQAPAADRTSLWAQLVDQLRPGELDELIASVPSIEMMSWNEIRSLPAAGVAIGSHGCLHELQHARQPVEVRVRELAASKARIEAQRGAPCRWFAFPNGTTNERSAAEVRSCGYEHGFSTGSRAVRSTDDPMLLPRLLPAGAPEKLVRMLVFGS